MDKIKITKFEDMPVWQDSQTFAVSVYAVTKKFPADELYSLTNQMRRASSSVSANIAEGFGRKSTKERSQYYRIAYGSLLETKNFIYLSHRLNYIDTDTETTLLTSCEELQKQINAILRYFNSHE